MPFQDHAFRWPASSGAPRRFGQTNYRIVRDRDTGRRAVWFLGTTLGSWTVVVPRWLWRLPWHYGRFRVACEQEAGGRYLAYRFETRSRWAPLDLTLDHEPERPLDLTGGRRGLGEPGRTCKETASSADSLVMGHALRQSARIRAVAWRDLTALRPAERLRELLLPLPFLVAARAAYAADVPLLPWLASAYFFLAGLRVVHDAFHDNLALPRRANHGLHVVLSTLMLGSMHAVRITHLQHHRDCLGPDDVEGQTARRSAWRAIGAGVAFPFALHRAAWRRARGDERRWIAAELAITAALLALAIAGVSAQLTHHVGLMAIAQTLTGFFAVWSVHHDVDAEIQVARTLRDRLKSALALGMFFHLEHHLFPRVPTCHLPELAARLDEAAPDLSKATVY